MATPPPLELTLLRHGRSRADDENVHEGRYGSPLNAVGVAQAEKLAAYRQARPPGFERIVCSSLVRARRTAEIIGAALGLEAELDDAWMEFDNGPVAGLAYAEAKRRYPAPAFRGRFEPFTADVGESYAALVRRVDGALERLFQGSANTSPTAAASTSPCATCCGLRRRRVSRSATRVLRR